MTKWLSNRDQARHAERVIAKLEGKIKDGSATDEDRQRYNAGVDHLLIWEWQEEWQTIKAGDVADAKRTKRAAAVVGGSASPLRGLRAGRAVEGAVVAKR